MSNINYKISFCIVCMNRSHHLRSTIIKNILDNNDYENVEFILVDYNSVDNLESFVRNELESFLQSGLLFYYKTFSPTYFRRSHSRNIAFKLASGDILCNLDADNYTGSHFASYINKEFNKTSNIFLTSIGSENNRKDVSGRICIKRSHFFKLNGFDERMVNYGFEDIDMVNRLELSGATKIVINNPIYLNALEHDEKERTSNEYVSKNLEILLLNYLSPSSTECIYLFKDFTYSRAIVINNLTYPFHSNISDLQARQLKYNHSILEEQWIKGNWETDLRYNILLYDGSLTETLILHQKRNCYFSKKDHYSFFYIITNDRLIQEAVMFYGQITNRIIMEQNIIENKIEVNEIGFGKDIVFKNFDYAQPIKI